MTPPVTTTAPPPAEEVEYPSSDGMPMAESDIHRDLLVDVVHRLRQRYAGRADVYVSGNLFVYYARGKPMKSLAPDGFVAFGVPSHDREVYKVWEENGVFPAVVFEHTSATTQREDVFKKFAVYQDDWKVKELFLFDPTEDYLTPPLRGYRLTRGKLNEMRPTAGRVTSRELGVTLEAAGPRLILRDTATGRELPLPAEAERDVVAAERDAAVAELVRLRAELAALRGTP